MTAPATTAALATGEGPGETAAPTTAAFATGEPMTLEAIGDLFGVTRERVRQIQMDALKRLRRILESEGFNEEAMFG